LELIPDTEADVVKTSTGKEPSSPGELQDALGEEPCSQDAFPLVQAQGTRGALEVVVAPAAVPLDLSFPTGNPVDQGLSRSPPALQLSPDASGPPA
jgi:hypothetical protein